MSHCIYKIYKYIIFDKLTLFLIKHGKLDIFHHLVELVLTNKESFVIFLCSQLFLHKSFLQFGENFCNKLFVSFAPVGCEVVSTNSIYWVKQNTKLAANRTNNDTIFFQFSMKLKYFYFSFFDDNKNENCEILMRLRI